MTSIRMLFATTFVIAVQTAIASAQNTSNPSEVWKTNPFADLCVSGNCANGKGRKEYDNGDTYEGDFVDSKRRGKGKLTYKNGDIYVGDFISDRKEGHGTLTYKNGDLYIGGFGIDLFYLKGRMKYANGDIYEGSWAIGLREGHGTYTFKDGNYYTGEWKDDKFNGQGKYFAKASNTTRSGTWKNGAFVNVAGVSKIIPADPEKKPPVSGTAARLIGTLNGKFDFLENKPLNYILTYKKTKETLRYQIGFINDGGRLAFRWKEVSKNEQSDKLVITDSALASASKFVNFFSTRTAIAPDKEIAFILSQALYKSFKANNEVSLDLGSGVKRLTRLITFTASTGTFTDRIDLKEHRLQADDGVTKVQLLDDPICPLITKIETAEYTLTLVRG